MLFPTHVAAGYVLGDRLDLPLVAVVAGAALPDLIDKPLATVGATELYHSVAHSGLTPLAIAVSALAFRRHRATAAGLFAGWASHLALDALGMVVNGRAADVQFLLWPIVRHEPAVGSGPIAFLFHYVSTPSAVLDALILIAAAVTARDRAGTASATGE